MAEKATDDDEIEEETAVDVTLEIALEENAEEVALATSMDETTADEVTLAISEDEKPKDVVLLLARDEGTAELGEGAAEAEAEGRADDAEENEMAEDEVTLAMVFKGLYQYCERHRRWSGPWKSEEINALRD